MSVIIEKGDAVTAYGMGMDALWSGLCSNVTAIRPSDRLDRPGFVSNLAAEVDALEIDAGQSRVMAVLDRLLGPLAGTLDPQTPLILSTTIGESDFVERAVFDNKTELLSQASPDRLLAKVKRSLRLEGEAAVVSSACASSAVALTRGAAMIRHGQADRVLIVACDAVTEFLYAGFSGLLSLSEQPARPFDAERDGLSLGEGAAWILLGDSMSQPPRDGDLMAEVCGWGNTTDAVHMTAPDRAGRGLARAIGKACHMAGVQPNDIDMVVAHGTATTLSDAMEITALRRVLPKPTPTISIKGATGHTCGATGLIQALVACRAMQEGRLPPTVGLTNPDPDGDGRLIQRQVDVPKNGLAISMNSGFGGVNTVVMFRGVA